MATSPTVFLRTGGIGITVFTKIESDEACAISQVVIGVLIDLEESLLQIGLDPENFEIGTEVTAENSLNFPKICMHWKIASNPQQAGHASMILELACERLREYLDAIVGL